MGFFSILFARQLLFGDGERCPREPQPSCLDARGCNDCSLRGPVLDRHARGADEAENKGAEDEGEQGQERFVSRPGAFPSDGDGAGRGGCAAGALLCPGAGDRLCRVAGGERSAVLAIQRAQAAGERGDGSERGACGGERSGAMAGPQPGAMCAALAEAAGLGQELYGEGSSFRQVSGCLQRAEASAAAPAPGSLPARCGVR